MHHYIYLLLKIMIKLLLTVIILLALFSCGRQKGAPKQESTATDSTASVQPSTSAPDSAEMLQKLQAYVYDSTIYDHHLPAELKNYLSANLQDWKLPEPTEWDALWFQNYRSTNSLVNFISGDFNCDAQKDYTLLLSNKRDSSLAVWIIHSGNNGLTSIKLDEYGKPDNHIQLGLELVEAGNLNYIDPDMDDTKSIKLECPAIQVVFFEKGATTYYWDKDKYSSVQTGD